MRRRSHWLGLAQSLGLGWAPLASTLLVALSCGGGGGGGKASQTHWQLIAQDLPEAVLSVGGASAQDVWAVGADRGQGPLVLHFDGSGWIRVATGTRGTLWWTQSFSDGTVMMAGAQSTILTSSDRGATFTRMKTPGLASYTVFGVWGASSGDVYAVGSVSGRDGFVWHWDGAAWSALDLPDGLPASAIGDPPGFFKVWGDGAGHVYVAGGRGVILRRDDAGPLQLVGSGAEATLFTVHGTAFGAVAVGGAGADQGTIRELPLGGGVKDVTPVGAPLIQGVALESNGHGIASGKAGAIFERNRGVWRVVNPGFAAPDVESLHAVWIDPAGGAWVVGGNVLTTALDNGAILYVGRTDVAAYQPPGPTDGGAPDAAPPAATCPAAEVDPAPAGSIARRWNEQTLNAIRRDLPRPVVHARNLFHTAAAMWDAWAAYDASADGVFVSERQIASDVAAARREAVSYAAYRLLLQRYQPAVGGAVSVACLRAFMTALGYDPDDRTDSGDTPRALGNRVGAAVIAATLDDGANERSNYADTTGYLPVNRPLVVDEPGVTLVDPSHWQELNLALAETQNGIVTAAGVQGYIGSNWGLVTPFAMTRALPAAAYHDPGAPPAWDQPEMQDWIADLLRKSAALDHTDGETIDISPGAYGNNSLGANDGAGRALNPETGAAYAPQVVPRGDFARVLAEFWADGPKSETPPGHWYVLANTVADHPATTRRLFGSGDALDPLAWDVHVYLALGGAVHDAAITSWEQKRLHTCARPISLVRYLAQLGQSSEPSAPDYDPHGLPLIAGVSERITADSAAPGQRHAHLRRYIGQLAVRSWRGEPGDRAVEVGGVDWLRGIEWIPYQRRTFVTPAFPGFTSGHSTFSRAAAEVLVALTGSAYFPGGLGEFVAPAGSYLVFEDGPSTEVRLQWATYYDAADQAGQSRIYGGIHIQADDFAGRKTGSGIGLEAVARSRTYFDGSARP